MALLDRPSFVAILTALTIVFVLWRATLVYDSSVYNGWQRSATEDVVKYTEEVQEDQLFRTNVNTWSNLAYVFVGIYAFLVAYKDSTSKLDHGNYLQRTPIMSVLFSFGCVHLGIGSGLFHASLTRFGQQLDVAAMYSPLLAFIAISFGRWFPRIHVDRQRIDTIHPLCAMVLLSASLFFVYKWELDAWFGYPSSTLILPLLIAVTYILAIIDRFVAPQRAMTLHWMLTSLVCLVVGVHCRTLDVKKQFSSPSSIFQGHSVWHVLTAAAMLLMYLHHHSERLQGTIYDLLEGSKK